MKKKRIWVFAALFLICLSQCGQEKRQAADRHGTASELKTVPFDAFRDENGNYLLFASANSAEKGLPIWSNNQLFFLPRGSDRLFRLKVESQSSRDYRIVAAGAVHSVLDLVQVESFVEDSDGDTRTVYNWALKTLARDDLKPEVLTTFVSAPENDALVIYERVRTHELAIHNYETRREALWGAVAEDGKTMVFLDALPGDHTWSWQTNWFQNLEMAREPQILMGRNENSVEPIDVVEVKREFKNQTLTGLFLKLEGGGELYIPAQENDSDTSEVLFQPDARAQVVSLQKFGSRDLPTEFPEVARKLTLMRYREILPTFSAYKIYKGTSK